MKKVLPDAFSPIFNADGRVRAGRPGGALRNFLDPARLHGEPAVLEGQFGRGNVFYRSFVLIRLGDRNGAVVLRTLWDYLASGWSSESPQERFVAKAAPSGLSGIS